MGQKILRLTSQDDTHWRGPLPAAFSNSGHTERVKRVEGSSPTMVILS